MRVDDVPYKGNIEDDYGVNIQIEYGSNVKGNLASNLDDVDKQELIDDMAEFHSFTIMFVYSEYLLWSYLEYGTY